MTVALNMTQSYTDLAGLESVRVAARRNDPDALRAVARQFEGLFLQMMLKSMRDASFGDPLFASNGLGTYQDLYDKQLSLNLSGQGQLGLADVLEQQLKSRFGAWSPDGKPGPAAGGDRSAAGQTGLLEYRAPAPVPVGAGIPAMEPTADTGFEGPEDFIRTLMPHARHAAAQLGVDPRMLLAQAALETGWGRALIRHPDGRNSFNLFGIKADPQWPGSRAEVLTREFISGRPYQVKSAFRAYDSYADSFADYVRLLRSGPRYRAALEGGLDGETYMRRLQAAGYATDPHYADKVISISRREDLWSGMNTDRPAPDRRPKA